MKLGQLISMDAGDVLPPELTDILARLRADADFMPPKQLKQVLNGAFGEGWLKQFARFDVRPVAAASIGQVHRAQLKDGREIALKVQYPGVRRSIDSDVDNVGSLIKVSGLLPDGFDLAHLLEEAKKQLHQEADYIREAGHLSRFHQRVGSDPRFLVPEPIPEFSTETVLAMTYIDGAPIEAVQELPEDRRSEIIDQLLDLTLSEVFDWQHMQTDPNFANYRYDRRTDQIILLDFGAATDLPEWVSSGYYNLLRAGLSDDVELLKSSSLRLGFWSEDLPEDQQEMIFELIRFSFELLSREGIFDFGDPKAAQEMRARGLDMAQDATYIHFPPIETLLVQRKLAGMYLLARQLGAQIDLNTKIRSRVGLA